MAAARRRGAHDLRVFGSVARGEARDDSDVDFLVRLDEGRGLFELAGLKDDFERILGRDVDVVTDAALRSDIRERVLAEAIPL